MPEFQWRCFFKTLFIRGNLKKSQFIQFILTFLLGPLGLFYSSIAAALALMILTFSISVATLGFALGVGGLLIWPISILVGFITVSKYNERIDIEEEKHQEILEAQKGGNENNFKEDLFEEDKIPQELLEPKKGEDKNDLKENLLEEDKIPQELLKPKKDEDKNDLKVNLLEEDKPPW